MNISLDIKRKFHCAVKGYFFWRRLIHQPKAKEAIIVFFPTKNESINKSGLKYLNKLITAANKKYALILSCCENMATLASVYSNNIADFILLTEEQKENLLAVCSLIAIDNRLFIVSMSDPFGRNADKLVGKRGTTVEQAIEYGALYLPRQANKHFQWKRIV